MTVGVNLTEAHLLDGEALDIAGGLTVSAGHTGAAYSTAESDATGKDAEAASLLEQAVRLQHVERLPARLDRLRGVAVEAGAPLGPLDLGRVVGEVAGDQRPLT